MKRRGLKEGCIMTTKIAVAILHGMGSQKKSFAKKTIVKINSQFQKRMKELGEDPTEKLVIQPVLWAPVFESEEANLFQSTVRAKKLHYQHLREFVIEYLGDAVAYQPVEELKQNYDKVHQRVGKELHTLSEKAGKQAPLCVLSHSLGAVIASNYFYDLQMKLEDTTCVIDSLSPLERGDTLTLFYTMGTTLPIWYLRYDNFTRPINIPSENLEKHHANLKGEWINFYNKNDIFGLPLKPVNENYHAAVSEDREVNVGNLLTSWNPFSHNSYLTDKKVIQAVVEGLVRTWRAVNDR